MKHYEVRYYYENEFDIPSDLATGCYEWSYSTDYDAPYTREEAEDAAYNIEVV